MHSRIAQCGSLRSQPCPAPPASLPPLSKSSAVGAAQQLLMPICDDNSSPIVRLRAGKIASDSVNTAAAAASVICCCRQARRKTVKVTSLRATVQESSRVSLVVENGVAAAAAENGATILVDRSLDHHHHPSDHIGFGSLLENGTFFRERFVIRFSEAGPRGTITLETFTSLLQEAATNQVIAMDYAFSPGKNLEGNITVITRMHIEVDRYPAWRDLLEIDTWFQREGKNAVRRDWIVKDVRTGQKIAFATSTWVLMNTVTRRLTKLTEEQWAELTPHLRQPARWALSEERRNSSLTKIPKLGNDATYKIHGLTASEKDTDMNQHVNNIRYLSWMLESTPDEVKSAYEVSKVTLEYRQEVGQGQIVESMAEPEEDLLGSNSRGTRQFTHLVQTTEIGKEINRGRSVWRPVV